MNQNLISFISNLVENSTSIETLRNFKLAMDNIYDLSKFEEIEVTDEGSISFCVYSNDKILKSAIGDKHYYIIVSSPNGIIKSEKYSVSKGFNILKEEIYKL